MTKTEGFSVYMRTINGVTQPFRGHHIPELRRGRIIEHHQKRWKRWMALPFGERGPAPEPFRVQFDPERLPQ